MSGGSKLPIINFQMNIFQAEKVFSQVRHLDRYCLKGNCIITVGCVLGFRLEVGLKDWTIHNSSSDPFMICFLNRNGALLHNAVAFTERSRSLCFGSRSC
jgi:hypothetical protein